MACLSQTQIVCGADTERGWTPGDRAKHWTPGYYRGKEFNATDDWLPGGDYGQITCPEGEFSGDWFQPCPPGTDIHIRDSWSLSQVFSDDPRLAGLATVTFSANFGPDFTGKAWGTLTLEVEACEDVWDGVWSGRRTFVPGQTGPGPGVWLGVIKITAHGRGGCVDRLRYKATEINTTLTPFPAAYEMFLPCEVSGCLPEGVLTGKITKPWWHRAEDND
ncbi:MAG: hypothetical protein GY732_15185 [Gammaproteobacteria bacterium]|nr:hypothetical protein [Gammaproteobacteria bacterium]